MPTAYWEPAVFRRETFPKLKQQFERRNPKHDWRNRALVHSQEVECSLYFAGFQEHSGQLAVPYDLD